ncbi:uncharacterized protein [Haliotis cracherodii]|uniref:uncharacterized protein n=1 Tax=Haliotis cracherodii TaxID=6455 RepID=UPI0039EC3CD0
MRQTDTKMCRWRQRLHVQIVHFHLCPSAASHSVWMVIRTSLMSTKVDWLGFFRQQSLYITTEHTLEKTTNLKQRYIPPEDLSFSVTDRVWNLLYNVYSLKRDFRKKQVITEIH